MIVMPPFNEAKLEKLWANIALLEFRRQLVGAIAVEKMVDGIVDEYEDETGIDTGSSSGQLYDSTDDYYYVGINNLINITGGTSAIVFLGDEGGSEKRLGQSINLASPAAVKSIALELGANNGAPTGGITARIETDNAGQPSGTLVDANATVSISSPTASAWNTFTFPAVISLAASTKYWLVFDCSNQSNDVAFRIQGAYASQYANGETWQKVNGTWTQKTDREMNFKVNTSANICLISQAFTASAQASKSRIFLFEQDVDAVTLNTDLLAYASRDGGTTWSQITLASFGLFETGKNVIGGIADISGQPAGTSMKYKIVSANAKSFKLHGTGLLWQ